MRRCALPSITNPRHGQPNLVACPAQSFVAIREHAAGDLLLYEVNACPGVAAHEKASGSAAAARGCIRQEAKAVFWRRVAVMEELSGREFSDLPGW